MQVEAHVLLEELKRIERHERDADHHFGHRGVDSSGARDVGRGVQTHLSALGVPV